MSDTKDPLPPPGEIDQERHFRTEHLEADIKGRSIRSGFITITSQGLKFSLNIGSNIILARLLAPEDFGLLAMTITVTDFVELFKDMGLSAATVQRERINHSQISTLFWINFGVSCVLMLLTFLLVPAIAWFYQEPRLTGIVMVLACGLLFSGMSVQHVALLKRQMRFKAIAYTEITSMIVSVTVAIIAAQLGAGYWALVLMKITQPICIAIGAWLLCDWRPGLPKKDSQVASMLAFGGNLTGFTLVNYFSRNLDNILIGWRWGAGELGLYAKAYQLLLLPIWQINIPITSVAIPTLSRLQGDPEKYRAYYRKGILVLVTLGMPLVAFMFVAADHLIVLILGQQWLEAIEIFRRLAPAAFIGTFNVCTGWVYTSIGRTDRQLIWGLISSSAATISFIIGLQWGAIGVATAYSTSVCITRLPGIIYCFKDSPLKLTDLGQALFLPATASLGAAAVLTIVQHWIPADLNHGVGLLVDTLIYGFLYLGIWVILPNGKKTLFAMLELIKDIRTKPKSTQAPKE